MHPGFEIVINPGVDALAQMGDFVRGMHEESGLLEHIPAGATVAEAERQVIEYLAQHVPNGRRPIVAGNTIGMDRRFIAKYMPLLEERLHYRSVDVSTIKELARQWYPATFFGTPEKHGGHRALADIAESIRELAYFREAVLVAGSGPDKSAAEALARSVTDRYAPLTGVGTAEAEAAELGAAEAASSAGN